ncbi:MAG: A/G-specific adenine glycosylase [Chitinophagaceae bacterium]
MNPDFSRLLLKWNKEQNDRKMPWKGEKDPYKIWLSEIILQQTRVEQGWAYYEKFINFFPTITHLAKAKDEKVFKLWEGLGYYTRCKNLLSTARKIYKDYQGIFPSDYENIKKLKGIGPYTAAAIASFAFDLPYAVVDGNVQRVLSRYFGVNTAIDTSKGKRFFDELAQSLLNKKSPSTYNQAIMDFGAVICKPQNPLCLKCIQKNDCVANKLNCVKELPVKEKRLIKKDRWFYYYLFVVNQKIYVRKRTQKDIWQNLYEFVLEETKTAVIHSFDNPGVLKNIIGKNAYTIVSVSKTYRQMLSHQVINGQFIVVALRKELPSLKECLLTEKNKLNRLAFPGIINQYLESQPEIFSTLGK